MAIEKRHERGLEKKPASESEKSGGMEMWEDLGLDVDSMSPPAQIATGAISVLGVVGGAVILFAFVPWLWWLVFIFGWTVFPAVGLLLRGVAGLVDSPKEEKPPENDKERELLEAIHNKGELTPAQAAMETSLSVKEADGMLKELAEGGHLDVRVRGGGLFYALWDHDRDGSEG